MKMRTQMIVAALVAASGGSLLACGTCGRSYYARPEPVREIVMTRPVTTSCYTAPRIRTLAPVGERIYTRTWVSRPAPVGELVTVRRSAFSPFSCNRFSRLEPVGERVLVSKRIYRTKRCHIPRRAKIVRVTRTTLAPIAERVVTVRNNSFCPTW